MSKREAWRISLGERNLRVYLFERTPGGNIYREVWIDGERVASKKSLGHKDRERAKEQAYALLSKLKSRKPLPGGRLTLAALFDKWKASEAFASTTEATQRRRESTWERLMSFLGEAREVSSLRPDDVRAYTRKRMSGKNGVRANTVRKDLSVLRTALNWAAGERLIERNPIGGVRLPSEKNPKRPVATPERYRRTLEKAPGVSPSLRPLLILAHETGRRLSSLLALRAGDVGDGTLRFRAEADKQGYDSTVPISQEAQEAVREALRGRVGDVPLFPHPEDPVKPASRHMADRWLREAEDAAGLEPLDGSLWHAYRRKFASDMGGSE